MAPYLVYASNTHPTFRIPELLSLAKFNGIALDPAALQHDLSQPFFVLDLKDDDEARRLIARNCAPMGPSRK